MREVPDHNLSAAREFDGVDVNLMVSVGPTFRHAEALATERGEHFGGGNGRLEAVLNHSTSLGGLVRRVDVGW